MRKLAAVVSTGMLAGAFGSAAIAAGALPKAPPQRVTASVSPHRLSSPFTLTTSGKVVLPKLICPSGVTTPAYCARPPADACSGKVEIKVSLGIDPHLADSGKQVEDFTTKLTPKCTYLGTTTIPDADLTSTVHLGAHARGRYDGVYVQARYLGNSVLLAKSAPTKVVQATLINR